MAKKTGGPNKSQAIRDYYAAKPDAKPMQVADDLGKQGIIVSAAFVSTIRSNMLSKGKKVVRKRGRPAGTKKAVTTRTASVAAPRAGGASSVSLDGLIKAKGLAKDLGGIDKAIAALTALQKLGV